MEYKVDNGADDSKFERLPLLPESVTEYIPTVSAHRSYSPESVISDSVEFEPSFEEYFTHEDRPESPNSLMTGIEKRPLSADSVPEYRPMSPESIILLSDIRGSSPESVSACRPLSPDSPIPQYSAVIFEPIAVLGCRSSSTESLASDTDNELDNFTTAAIDYRPSSSISLASVDESRPLPPESPIPDFGPSFLESIGPLYRNRSCSPESMCSDSIEYESFLGDLLNTEQRAESPDSFVSEFEDRPLSPDSIPEYRPMSPEAIKLLSDIRRSSPESYESMNEFRPLSPDSPVPQFSSLIFEPVPVTQYRSSSPDSLESDVDFELNVFTAADFGCRSLSLDSVASVDENRPLSPDSPVLDFRTVFTDSTLPVSIHRSFSLESVISDSVEFEPSFEEFFSYEDRPESPNSLMTEIEERPHSADSVPEYRPMSPESIILLSDIRGSSPESVSACRPLSPDSPIPQYSAVIFEPVAVLGCRSSSTESLASDTDNELDNFTTAAFDYRLSSSISLASVDESRPLPPESPIPDFGPSFLESIGPLYRNRSCSPESMCSDSIEYESFLGDLLNTEQRAESPDSFVSEFEDRPLSPDSIPEYRPMSPEAIKLLSDIRRSSPESYESMNEFRPLSPDSPVPQFSSLIFEPVPVTQYRSSSPDSLESDVDYELNVFTAADFGCRSLSLDSVASVDENRPLSPDSPVLDFRTVFTDSTLPVSIHRSFSLESVISDSVEFEPSFEEFFSYEDRPESPNSLMTEIEERPHSADSVPEYRPMSPESIILLSDIRGSSPESVSACRPLSPDSPIPQYSAVIFEPVAVLGCRSSSTESLASDTDNELDNFTTAAFDYRPSSSISLASVDESRPLPPESPIPDFGPSFLESIGPLYRNRSCSPESMCSDSIEYESFLGDLLNTEQRAESPDSFVSEFEDRPLSPDSIPEYRPMSPEAIKLLSDIRRSSPESYESMNEFRPLSPDSPVPQFSSLILEPVPVTQYRSSSPDSLESDVDFELNVFTAADFGCRSLSLDSVASVDENRPLSPDSPVLDFRTVFTDSTLPVSIHRSFSLESVISDSVEFEPSFEEFFSYEDRPESPNSLMTEIEERPHSADSVPEYRPMSPESIILLSDIRGSSPESVSACRPLSPDSPIPQYSAVIFEPVAVLGCRSSSTESLASDTDNELDNFTTAAFDYRPSSSISLASVDESRPLPPESPIPDFGPSFLESIGPLYRNRSCSPESMCSDSIEYESFLGDLLNTEQRAESPDSFVSEFEDRPLSPDSIPEYRPMSPEAIKLLSDNRRSSPESYESMNEFRPLSPDSPVPQFSSLIFEPVPVTQYRSSSPDSLESDVDYELNVFTAADFGCRSLSLDSVASVDENRPLSPDSPVLDFRTVFTDSTLPVSIHRSFSLESVISDSVEFEPSFEEFFTHEERPESPNSLMTEIEERPHSADSVPEYRPMSPESIILLSDIRGSSPESVSACRPLSPDSPIPQYSAVIFEPVAVLGCRSSSTESLASDTDNELDHFTTAAFDYRPSSSISLASVDESRPLPPESPIPDFGPSFLESIGPLYRTRSCSPESICSDSIEYESFIGDLLNTEQRAESPDSFVFEFEDRPLSPDSIPEYRPMSPESILLLDVRRSSPESYDSLNEFRPLSPDSPVPQFSSLFFEPAPVNISLQSPIPVYAQEVADSEYFCFSDFDPYLRPDSPESGVHLSIDDQFLSDSLNKYKYIKEMPIKWYRSDSPESVTSDIEFELNVLSFPITDCTPLPQEASEKTTCHAGMLLLEKTAVREIPWNENRPLFSDCPVKDRHLTQTNTQIKDVRLLTSRDFGHSRSDPTVSETKPEPLLKENVIMVPQYKLVYKTVPLTLRSHIYDPQYRGEIFFPKTGIFEYTGCKMEIVQSYCTTDESVSITDQNGKTPSAALGTSKISKCDSDSLHVSHDNSLTESISSSLLQSMKQDRQSCEFTEENHASVPDSLGVFTPLEHEYCVEMSDRRASSPESVTSLNAFRPLTPDSPIFMNIPSLPYTGMVHSEIRPSSPDSLCSVNEFRRLSPDSPIPDFLGCLPVPDEQEFQFRPLPVTSESNVMEISPIISDLQAFDLTLIPLEKLYLMHPQSAELDTEQRPISPISDIFKCDSESISSLSVSSESACRCPSPEALGLDIEFNSAATPDYLIFEMDYRPESPESVISETQCKDVLDEISPVLATSLQEAVKQDKESHCTSNVALLHVVSAEKDKPKTVNIHESYLAMSEPQEQSQRSFKDDPNSDSKTLLSYQEVFSESEQEKNIESRQKQYPRKKEVKTSCADEQDGGDINTQGFEVKQELEFQDKHIKERSYYTSENVVSQESNSRALQDKVSEKDIEFKSQIMRELTMSHGVTCSTALLKDATHSGESSSTVQDCGQVAILEHKLELIASSLSCESSLEPGVSDHKSLPNAHEGNTSPSPYLEDVHPMTSFKQSLKQSKASGLSQIHTPPFQFYLRTSNRTVTPNLSSSTSPIFSFNDTPSDYRNVVSSSLRTVSAGTEIPPTDLSPLSPVFSELDSDQGPSVHSLLTTDQTVAEATGSFQFSPDFQQVLSEFEKTLTSLERDKPGMVFSETSLSPSSKDMTHKLKISKESTEPPDDLRLLDIGLKVKVRPAHADSLESEHEFFDCQQTFSDVSEPEIKSELLEVPNTIYKVEELPSLPSSPACDSLKCTPNLREHIEREDYQRPISWGSEELDLPIVLEPEDEYIDEQGEKDAYPYVYAREHPCAEELPPREEAQYDDDDDDDDDALGREIAEELGLLSDSSEEEVLTTRVVRRRVIIQGDEMPEIPPQAVTEEQYMDEHGNLVVKKITRKIIRKYFSADGTEREEVMVEGDQQEAITVDETDGFSKVVKRTVVKSGGNQTEVTFSEQLPAGGTTVSEFEVEPVQGRKVSKVVKTTVVQGERMEKQIGDPSLSADLPSAKDDFEKALSYAGGFEKVLLPHLVEKEIVEDGSVVRRTRMRKTCTQKKTAVRDSQGKHTHLERLEDTEEALRPDDLQLHLHQLLQRYCTPEVTDEPEKGEVAKGGTEEEKQDEDNPSTD
ncbi:ankyrin-2b isoform X1 [Brachyhypopomus gauderio]|uniref:ankyrin-2b isoform X1 n=1 Tax=Brachyhypopomus gauderio TaxID=698409 RepID=UPI0040436D72